MGKGKNRLWQFGVHAGLLLLGLVALHFDLLANFDRMFYDAIMRQAPVEAAPEIVLIEVDQKSLARFGRWPWPRALHAQLLSRLNQNPPAVVGLDFNFAEPDLEHPEQDAELLLAMLENGRVVLPVVLEQESAEGELRETLPMEPLARSAAALGHVDVELDGDGIARSVFLMGGLYAPRWPVFPLAMLEVSGTWKPGDPLPGQRAPKALPSGNWYRDYRALVPFTAQGLGFTTYSYVDVVEERIPLQSLSGKYVIVGATATGLGDNIPTPVSALARPTSGLEYMASVLNGLIANRLIMETPRWISYLLLVAIVALMALLYRHAGTSLVFWYLGIALLVGGGSFLLLSQFQLWLPPSVLILVPLLALGLVGWQLTLRLVKELFQERRLSQAALVSIGDAVLHLDGKMRIRQFNPQAEELLGLSGGEMMGQRFDDLVWLTRPGRNPAPFSLREFIGQGEQVSAETLTLTNAKGKLLPVHVAGTLIPGDDGESILVLSDLSRETELATALAHSETHSVLTGLPNRGLVMERLKKMLRRAHLLRHQVAVVQLDIDHFSKINQILGMEAGDQLLRQVAERLYRFRTRGVEIGHVGGDEFLVLLEGGNIEERVRMLRDYFARPVKLDGRERKISVSLGVSVYPDNLVEAEELVRQANIALQRCKQERRGEIVYFRQDMQQRAARVLQLNTLLQHALQDNLLETFYQPIVTAGELKIVGVECLMRLKDGSGGYISAEEFIPLAEESGTISELAFHQLYEACVRLQVWQREGLPPLRLSYNFSPRQLRSADLLQKLESLLQVTGFDPHRLEFEITENLVLAYDDEVARILNRLGELGIRLAIDDFGAGYSSMNYLTRFRFNRLKIDKSFIWDLDNTPESRAIISAIIGMAHSLEMKVVAEGVETEQHMEILTALGCDELQGYYLGRPLSAGKFREYLISTNGVADVDLARKLS